MPDIRWTLTCGHGLRCTGRTRGTDLRVRRLCPSRARPGSQMMWMRGRVQAPPGKLCVRPVFDPGVSGERAGYRPGRAHQGHLGHDGRIQTGKTENQVPRSANPQVSQSAGGGIPAPQPGASRAWRRSSGSGSAAVMICRPAWISMVRKRRAVLINFLIDQLVCASIHLLTATAAKTMVRWASMESRLRWWMGWLAEDTRALHHSRGPGRL